MRSFSTLSEYAAQAGKDIGTSDWLKITQDRIDRFADATGDHQWIHTDPERAMRDLGQPTIAHGYLTLSLLPHFLHEILHIASVTRAINYGSNRVRFINMIPVGARIRGHMALKRAELGAGTLRSVSTFTVEIDGADKPALVAEIITLYYE